MNWPDVNGTNVPRRLVDVLTIDPAIPLLARFASTFLDVAVLAKSVLTTGTRTVVPYSTKLSVVAHTQVAGSYLLCAVYQHSVMLISLADWSRRYI